MLLIETITFGLAVWLGIYIIARDRQNPLLQRAGLGIMAYALALLVTMLRETDPSSDLMARLQWASFVLPPVFWASATLRLADHEPANGRMDRFVLLPLGLLASFAMVFVPGMVSAILATIALSFSCVRCAICRTAGN